MLLFLLALPCSAQECKTYKLMPIPKVTTLPVGSCVRVIGTVTFVRVYGEQFRFGLMDSKDHSVMVTASEDLYTDEVIEVWGRVDGAGINSDKHLVIKGALPTRRGRIYLRKQDPSSARPTTLEITPMAKHRIHDANQLARDSMSRRPSGRIRP